SAYSTELVMYHICITRCATGSRATIFLHDALPICPAMARRLRRGARRAAAARRERVLRRPADPPVRAHRGRGLARAGGDDRRGRSEEHTSELQSREIIVCRLLL